MSYGQLGLIEICAAFYTYFAIMAESGFWPARLLGLREPWNSRVNDLEDAFGQEWVCDFCTYFCHEMGVNGKPILPNYHI